MKQDDLLIALSHSGKTEEVLNVVSGVKDMAIPVISITQSSSSPLALASRVALSYGKFAESDHLGLAPTSSTTAMLALGDALSVTVSQERGFSRDDFLRCHSAGQLGLLCFEEKDGV